MGRKAKLPSQREIDQLCPVGGTWYEALMHAIEVLEPWSEFSAADPNWDSCYWHGDYSVGHGGFSLPELILMWFDLDYQWQDEPLTVWRQFAAALMTGKATFGYEDLGLSVRYPTEPR